MDGTSPIHAYTSAETKGMIALTTAGGISFLFIVMLVAAMLVSGFRNRKSEDPSDHSFIRTHVGIYFLCLLSCDFAQSIASIISISWIAEGAVHAGRTCTAQGVIYQFGNVGTALWSLVIAVHTFALLFLRIKVSSMACFSTFVAVWFMTGSIVAIGPALVQNSGQGPFHGLSGPWCWITEEYTGSRLGLEYFWMFFSAFLSCILYTLVFLRLRGNIILNGWSVKFRWVERSRAWNGSAGRETVESHVLSVARQMLWYPVAYTIVILPIAICRWTEFSGGKMPLAAVFATDGIFLLSGAVNVVLFTTTRRVIPIHNSSLPVHAKSTKDISTFVIARNSPTSFETDPTSPRSSEGSDSTAHGPLKPSYGYQWPIPPPAPLIAPAPLRAQSSYFFTPSSPDLRSNHSVALSSIDEQSLTIPIHLRSIPVVITTPPSPSPSQRTYATTTTDVAAREREIAEAQTYLPSLQRF